MRYLQRFYIDIGDKRNGALQLLNSQKRSYMIRAQNASLRINYVTNSDGNLKNACSKSKGHLLPLAPAVPASLPATRTAWQTCVARLS